MNVPLNHFMKVGIIHFMAFPEAAKGEVSVLESLKKIAADEYFDAVEITSIKDPGIRKKAKFLLESAHMTIAFGAQPLLLKSGLNINDTNKNGREKALALLKDAIDEAYEMGAKGFAFLSGRYKETEKDAAYQALVESTDQLCAYAKSKGDMPVILEVFDYDIDKKSLIGPAQLAGKFAREIGTRHENFGLMVDLSHLPLLREKPEEAILPVKDYLMHAHMGNCVIKDPALPAYGDMHPRFGFPAGENDVEQLAGFLQVLMDIGFLGEKKRPIVSFEVRPFGDEEPEIVIANAKRTLNEAWAIVRD